MDMRTLASSLPQAHQQQQHATDLSVKFKDAAMAITTLYRASTAAQKRAHNTGYAAALQDVLAFIRGGLSDGAAMDVGTVMDYAEARASAVAEDDDDDAPAPPPPPPAPTSTAKDNKERDNKLKPKPSVSSKENVHAKRRAQPKPSASPSPPPSSAPPQVVAKSEVAAVVAGAKRKHGLPEGVGFGAPGAGVVGEALVPRVRKGKPKSTRVPNPALPPAQPTFGMAMFGMGVDEDMDVEEERPRKRR